MLSKHDDNDNKRNSIIPFHTGTYTTITKMVPVRKNALSKDHGILKSFDF